jgi:isocitrate dehydrogenase
VSTTPPKRFADIILAAAALGLGLANAAAYGAWRAMSRQNLDTAARWSEFGDAMLFPGALIVAAAAAMVWLGWKANIDG